MIPGTVTLSNADTLGNNSLREILHNHDFPCTEYLDRMAIHPPAIYQYLKTLLYRHYLIPADSVPETMADLLTSAFYAWDTCAVSALGCSHSPHPASSSSPHTSRVAAVESNAEDVVKVSIDGGTTGKKIAVSDFYRQSFTDEKVWLTIFQVDDVENLLRAIFFEEKLIETLRINKYQYGT